MTHAQTITRTPEGFSKMTNIFAAVIALGLLAWAPFAAGAVIVSHDGTMPSEKVIVSYTAGSTSGYQWRRNVDTGRRDVGQSFRAPVSFPMASFSLEVQGNVQAQASLAPFTLQIFESGTQANIGSVISTQSGTFLSSALNPVNPGWITFDFDDVSATAGNYYTVMLEWDSTAATDRDQVFAAVSSGTYSDGRLWQAVDGGAYTGLGSDYHFSVQVVPEPSALILLALGGVALAGRRRSDSKS